MASSFLFLHFCPRTVSVKSNDKRSRDRYNVEIQLYVLKCPIFQGSAGQTSLLQVKNEHANLHLDITLYYKYLRDNGNYVKLK